MIELASVGKEYGSSSAPVTALHDVNLAIQRGEFVAVVGPSGSGKSTLLKALLGLAAVLLLLWPAMAVVRWAGPQAPPACH